MRRKKSEISKYSFASSLRKQGKTNPQFELILRSLTIEDLIALKLELAADSLKGKLYGYPVWKSSFNMVKESLLKFALSFTSSQKEAANLLGISLSELRRSIKQYNILKEEKK